MLDDFLSEGPIVHVEKTPNELEGFISEAALSTPSASSPVRTHTSAIWRRIGTPAARLWTVCLCGALTIGAVAMPPRSAPSQLDLPELQYARVFVAKTLVQFPAVRFTLESTTTAPPKRKRAPKGTRRAKL
jgi:hypothetical protein